MSNCQRRELHYLLFNYMQMNCCFFIFISYIILHSRAHTHTWDFGRLVYWCVRPKFTHSNTYI